MLTKTANKIMSGISNAAKNYWGVVRGDLMAKNTLIANKADPIREVLKNGYPQYNRVMKDLSRKIKDVEYRMANAKGTHFTSINKTKIDKLREMQAKLEKSNATYTDKLKSKLKPLDDEIRGNKLLTFGARGTAVAVPGIPTAYYANKKYDEFMEPNI